MEKGPSVSCKNKIWPSFRKMVSASQFDQCGDPSACSLFSSHSCAGKLSLKVWGSVICSRRGMAGLGGPRGAGRESATALLEKEPWNTGEVEKLWSEYRDAWGQGRLAALLWGTSGNQAETWGWPKKAVTFLALVLCRGSVTDTYCRTVSSLQGRSRGFCSFWCSTN